jgi:hypothetical protein
MFPAEGALLAASMSFVISSSETGSFVNALMLLRLLIAVNTSTPFSTFA